MNDTERLRNADHAAYSLADEVLRLREINAEMAEALDYTARELEMLCPDTAGTPAAQYAREVLAGRYPRESALTHARPAQREQGIKAGRT